MTALISRGLGITVLGVALMAGASAWAQTAPPATSVECRDPRPQICPQIYQPVCAKKRDGKSQTFGNGCTACANAEVVAHQPGPCS